MIDPRKRRRQRLFIIAGAGAALFGALVLVMVALNEQITFFQSPTDVAEKGIPAGERMRLGGLVEDGSVDRQGTSAKFVVTDGNNIIAVSYKGILPDLFREGQGIVAEGALDETGTFVADTVLAKHDENYMPREVADALKKQGHWQGGKDSQ